MLNSEKETVIVVHDGDKTVSVYSWRKTIWARCERAGLKKTLEDGGGREYVGDARLFKFRFLGPREKRPATPAQLEALKKAREKKGIE